MSTLAQHSAAFTIDIEGTIHTVPILDLEVTVDEERAPYWQASLTCPLVDVLRNVDPTDRVLWIDITLTRKLGRTDRILDLTRRYRDKLVSFITAQFTGDTLADITDTTYHDYETPGAEPADQVRPLRLTMRTLTRDYAADTARVTVSSGEGPLFDHALMDTNGLRAVGADLDAKVDWLIGQGTGFTLTHHATGTPLDADIADEAMWDTGQTVWECLQNLTRTHGYQVWCDSVGEFHLAETRPGDPLVALYAGDGPSRSITNVVETASRDDGWYTAVLVDYAWADAPSYDVAVLNPQGPHKVRRMTVDREGNRVSISTGRAQQTLDALTGRHRAIEVLGVSDYALNTGGDAVIDTPTAVWQGRISSIRWNIPEDQMSIRLRDAQEVA